LVQRNGGDALKVAVSLLGDTIIITEVTMKYPKAPGGVFRSVSQPDVQWKLQQLQDTANYCVQALTTTVKRIPFQCRKSKTFELKVTNLIGQARSSLCIPHKRTLLELCNFPSTRCFNPPLPNDLVFSYYIASTRIVCAAYLMTSKPNGSFIPIYIPFLQALSMQLFNFFAMNPMISL
uniref:Protein rogdi homolog (inferred by orthology to a C. elegans protein) n=1 Tax=Anisakis simplex TaxID=6269 RepID=A0A0M3JAY6_ANISI